MKFNRIIFSPDSQNTREEQTQLPTHQLLDLKGEKTLISKTMLFPNAVMRQFGARQLAEDKLSLRIWD